MKRIACVFLAEILLAGLMSSLGIAQSEPLGDYARSVRKDEKKNVGKKYDNDNLPTGDKISIVGNAQDSAGPEDANPGLPADAAAAKSEGSSSTASPDSPAKEAAAKEAAKKTEGAEAQKQADQPKPADQWKQKFADQKSKIDLLSRELDVAQREYRLRAAAFYSDAGNRLRNRGAWDKEDAQYKLEIAQKQKAVDDAKKALDDMKEQGRKTGVPAGERQ